MVKSINIQNVFLAEQVLKLQKVSYQKEAELINYHEIPPLTENLVQLMNSKETFVGFEKNKEIVGVLSYEIDNNEVTICRLAVNPENFRQGIAKALLRHLTKHIKVENIKVSTGFFNIPAVQFYLNEGFIKSHESKIDELSIIHFIKRVPKK